MNNREQFEEDSTSTQTQDYTLVTRKNKKSTLNASSKVETLKEDIRYDNSRQDGANVSGKFIDAGPRLDEAAASNRAIDASELNSSKPKTRKKKDSKEVRLRKREEAKFKAIYGPKDSHIQVLSPEVFAKIQANSSGVSPIVKSNVRNSNNETEIKSSTPLNETSQYKFRMKPWGRNITLRGADLDQEFPTLGTTLKQSPATNQTLELATNQPARQELNNSSNSEESCEYVIPQGGDLSEPVRETGSFHQPEADLSKTKSSLSSSIESHSPMNKKKPSKTPMIISIEALLSAKREASSSKRLSQSGVKKELVSPKRLSQGMTKKRLLFDEKSQQPAGNMLDSSGIKVMHRGKIREKPKRKRPSKLKKAILLSRQLRKQALNPVQLDTTQPSDEIESKSIDNMKLCKETSFDESKSETLNSSVSAEQSTCHVPRNSVTCQNDKSLDLLDLNLSVEKHEIKEKIIVEENQSRISPEKKRSKQKKNRISKQEQVKIKEESKQSDEIKEVGHKNCPSTSSYSINAEIGDSSGLPAVELEDEYFHKLIENSIDSVQKIREPTISMIEAAKNELHSRKFRKYCDMYTTKELHGHVMALLKELHAFQDKLYKTDMLKYKLKKRYVHGIKEINNYMSINKVQLLLIAPDIESNKNVAGGLDDILEVLISTAKRKNVPVIFTGNRYILGKPIYIKTPVSAIGILDHQGTEELYRTVLDEANKLRLKYQTDFEAKIQELFCKSRTV